MSEALRIRSLELLGGHPTLDFVNTLNWRDRAAAAGGAEECLVSFEALVTWARRAGLITAAEEKALTAAARRDPEASEAALRAAIRLREAISGLLDAARNAQHPSAAHLEHVNRWLAQASASHLIANADGYGWADRQSGMGFSALLGRLAHSAGELLTSEQLHRVGCCAGPGCGWLYVDTSPNRRRRWCSMEGCGNRAKAKRHYERSKTLA